MDLPNISKEEYEKLKAIYNSASKRRDAVNEALSEGKPFTRINNDTEAPAFEALFEGTALEGGTITEGIKIEERGGFLVRCEVITRAEFYVRFWVDADFSRIEDLAVATGSPW